MTPVLSRETRQRLDAFVALLMRWQVTTNLVASSTLSEVWDRHIADSLQLLDVDDAPTWADFGSGGGFPGVVLACALADRAGAAVHLIERNAKKAGFLREAIRITGSPGIVHHAAIEDVVPSLPPIACVTARAVAPLTTLLALAEPLLARGSHGLFLKGAEVSAEITQARQRWMFDATLHPSRTGPGAIVAISAPIRSLADAGMRHHA